MNSENTPDDLRNLFIEIIAKTSDCYLRRYFERAGIETTEMRAISPSSIHAGETIYMETLPVEDRIKHYFETIDWSNPKSKARLYPILIGSLKKLGASCPSHEADRLLDRLHDHNLVFDGVSLKRGN